MCADAHGDNASDVLKQQMVETVGEEAPNQLEFLQEIAYTEPTSSFTKAVKLYRGPYSLLVLHAAPFEVDFGSSSGQDTPRSLCHVRT